jgi:death on curing protein
MFQPEFLDLEDVVEIHAHELRKYGGLPGTRDQAALESALAQPPAQYGGAYLHPSIYDMAAAYLYHLSQNHPFVDGNKRVAAVAAFVFLRVNGYTFDAPDSEFFRVTMGVARGQITKREIAVFLSRYACEAKA